MYSRGQEIVKNIKFHLNNFLLFELWMDFYAKKAKIASLGWQESLPTGTTK